MRRRSLDTMSVARTTVVGMSPFRRGASGRALDEAEARTMLEAALRPAAPVPRGGRAALSAEHVEADGRDREETPDRVPPSPDHRGEFEALDDDRLIDTLKSRKEELYNLRFLSATGQLESHGQLKSVRRDIQQIYAILRERELGAPSETAPKRTTRSPRARRRRRV